MLFYLRSDFSPNNILSELRHYLNILSYNYNKKYRNINSYLIKNYNINLNMVLNSLKQEIKITPIENKIFQLYIDKNIHIGKNNLNIILNFLEYGNLEINSPKIISSLMRESIKYTKLFLEGY